MSEHICGRIIRLFGKHPRNDNWFAGVIKFPDGSSAKIAGVSNVRVSVGMTVECEANLVDTDYGEQFQPVKGSMVSRVLLNRQDVVQFLSSDLFPGVGEKTATTIYDAFGMDTMSMLKTDLDKVAATCKLKAAQTEALRVGIRSTSGVPELVRAFPHMRVTTAQRIVEKHPRTPVSTLISDIWRNLYRELRLEYRVSMREADMIALLDQNKPEFNYDRIDIALHDALGRFMRDRNATYVRISDPAEWSMFFWDYFMRTDLYQPFPQVCGGARFDESVLATWISNWKDEWLPMFRTSECRVGTDGNYEVGLYQGEMLSAEDALSRRMAEAYDEDVSVTQGRFLQFHRLLKERRAAGIQEAVSQEQLMAIGSVFQNRVSFLSGGPGRGKTRTLSVLISFWRALVSNNILLLAPTGKAVNRMKAQTGYANAETVARFLSVNRMADAPVTDAFGYRMRMDSNTLVIVDESSMLDFQDAAKLWERVEGSTILFVGDKDQLSPVEPGPFLQECLRSHKAYVSHLTQNFRTSVPELAESAEKILAGKRIAPVGNFEVWPCAEEPGDGQALSQAEQFILERYMYHMQSGCEFSDVLVIAPFANPRYRLSSGNLNRLLQDRMNPLKSGVTFRHAVDAFGMYYDNRGTPAGLDDGDGIQIRIGDRVMNTKNNMSVAWHVFKNDDVGDDGAMCDPDDGSNQGIFNGDTGTVVRAYEPAGNRSSFAVLIALDDTRPEVDRKADPQPTKYVWVVGEPAGKGAVRLKDWSLGYALSVHKAQGSEAAHVIVAMSEAGYRATKYRQSMGSMPFLTRNMLYTAATRASESVMIVGSMDAVNACIDTPYQYTNVRLAEAIDQCVPVSGSWPDGLATYGGIWYQGDC